MATRDEKEAEVEDDRIIWAREEPGTRRPAYSRDAIAEAALKVADTEGFHALSMRRVAQELGAGTMTLYHYVRNKDELITLMGDRVMSEILVPDGELPADWREAISLIARKTRDVFINHRWCIDHMEGGDGGPNGMRHFEQSLKAVESTGLPAIERLDIVSLVDDYVFGFVLREKVMGLLDSETPSQGSPEAWSPATLQYFDEQVATGEYPHIAELRGEGTAEESIRRIAEVGNAPDRFERGLNLLLDGIEASLKK